MCIVQCNINTTIILLTAWFVCKLLHLPMVTVLYSCARAVGNITYIYSVRYIVVLCVYLAKNIT